MPPPTPPRPSTRVGSAGAAGHNGNHHHHHHNPSDAGGGGGGASRTAQAFRLVLGSGSYTRQQLLREMGLRYDIVKADIDEKAVEWRTRDPQLLVRRLGHAKADAVLRQLAAAPITTTAAADASASASASTPTLLLTGDQVVVHRGEILEKPASADEARRFISGYASAPAATVGSIVVTNVRTGQRYDAVDRAEVYFRQMPAHVVEQLIERGDVYYCAGGLMVEDPLVSHFVDHIVGGGIDSVMGLNKALTQQLIDRALADDQRGARTDAR